MTSERLDQMTSERLDQMTSERLDQMTSERLDQMTSERLDQLSYMQQETGGATTEEWPDSGDDSDAELHVSDASSISIGSMAYLLPPTSRWGGHKVAPFTFCKISPKPDKLRT